MQEKLVTHLSKNFFETLLRKRGEIIVAAIDHAMGRQDWTIDDVKNRGEFNWHDDLEIFIFDNKPMLEIRGYVVEDAPGKPPCASNGFNEVRARFMYKKLYE